MTKRTNKQIALTLFTVALYTFLLGWKIALVISFTISFHEYSHILAARYLKLKTGGFSLIPGVGGLALLLEQPKSQAQQATVSLAGPIGGGVLALIVFGIYCAMGSSFWGATACWMLFIQLANLIPVSILDGGQVLNSITYSYNRKLGMWINAVATGLAFLFFMFRNPFIAFFIMFLGGSAVQREFRNYKHFQAGERYLCDNNYLYPPKTMNKRQVAAVLTVWAAALFVLGSPMYWLITQGISWRIV
jgi:Zn-dependent protease